MHAMNINSCHSPTKFLQPANLTTYTILSLLSVQVELAPLPYCHPSWAICIFLIQITNRFFTYASPYLWNQLPSSSLQPHSVHSSWSGSPHPVHHITCGIKSTPFFIPSTSLCSLSSWFTSFPAYHHSHHLRSYHLSLPRPFTPDLKLISHNSFPP